MSDLTERVARAIAGEHWYAWQGEARAAIREVLAALREPSEDDGSSYGSVRELRRDFRSMLARFAHEHGLEP